jgi:DNA-binding CsgD family transcriptional regulator
MKSVFFLYFFICCYSLQMVAYGQEISLSHTYTLDIKNGIGLAEPVSTYDPVRVMYEEAKVPQQPLSLLTQEKEMDTLYTDMLISCAVALLLAGGLLYKKHQSNMYKNRQQEEIRQAMLQAELENRLMREKELQRALEIKNQELASYNMNLLQKNGMIEELRNNIENLKKTPSEQLPLQLKHIKRLLDNSLHIDKDWENFKLHFAQVHPSLFHNLKEGFPELSNNDLKLCALIKLNLNLKESAAILGIAPESVKSARYRLRKKFNLSHQDSLVDFIRSMDEKAPVVLSA